MFGATSALQPETSASAVFRPATPLWPARYWIAGWTQR